MKENDGLAEKKMKLQEFQLSFPYKRPGFITGDASHLHTWLPYGLERIKKYYPNALVITIMRDPIERAFSQFMMDQKFQYISKQVTFEDYIEIELILRKRIVDPEKIESVYEAMRLYSNKFGWVLSRGVYHIYIQRILDLGLRWKPVFLSDLHNNYDTTVNKLYDELGLKSFEPPKIKSNVGSYNGSIADSTESGLRSFYQMPNEKLQLLISKPLPWV